MLPVPLASLPLPPSTIQALSAAGYETLQDLRGIPLEDLSRDYNVPMSMIQALSSSQAPASAVALSQSLASMTQGRGVDKMTTLCDPLDQLLSGGITLGTILEISGPPGTPKDNLAIKICRSFVASQKRVLFVDFQNMTSPTALKGALHARSGSRLISYLKIHRLERLMTFIHNLSSYLTKHPEVSLLVLSSISFPFQTTPDLTLQAKTSLQEVIKIALTKACVSHGITIVTTSQLATKFLNSDGSAGTFETGAKGIMVPLLGSLSFLFV
ncbi:hypothetical protein BDZ89DRAFT_1135715 [Hymenopellis radicata]|nr:hypothetical protein BDZ89DRAFT_1135715 [Hymenopellis radicata]